MADRLGDVDPAFNTIVERCDDPLIVPNVSDGDPGSDIAFAASAVQCGDMTRLYYSQSDRDSRCATLQLG